MLARYGRRLFFWRRIADNNILDTAARDSIENNFIESLVSDQKYLSSSDSHPSMVDECYLQGISTNGVSGEMAYAYQNVLGQNAQTLKRGFWAMR